MRNLGLVTRDPLDPATHGPDKYLITGSAVSQITVMPTIDLSKDCQCDMVIALADGTELLGKLVVWEERLGQVLYRVAGVSDMWRAVYRQTGIYDMYWYADGRCGVEDAVGMDIVWAQQPRYAAVSGGICASRFPMLDQAEGDIRILWEPHYGEHLLTTVSMWILQAAWHTAPRWQQRPAAGWPWWVLHGARLAGNALFPGDEEGLMYIRLLDRSGRT